MTDRLRKIPLPEEFWQQISRDDLRNKLLQIGISDGNLTRIMNGLVHKDVAVIALAPSIELYRPNWIGERGLALVEQALALIAVEKIRVSDLIKISVGKEPGSDYLGEGGWG